MKQQKHEPHKKGPTVVTTSSSSFTAHIKQPFHSGTSSSGSCLDASAAAPDYDVIMCGGTLGIMVALTLQQQGFRVAVVEKRVVQGRVQEWNTSRHECQVGDRGRAQAVISKLASKHVLNRAWEKDVCMAVCGPLMAAQPTCCANS